MMGLQHSVLCSPAAANAVLGRETQPYGLTQYRQLSAERWEILTTFIDGTYYNSSHKIKKAVKDFL